MRWNWGKSFSISARARWAGFGFAAATSWRRRAYHSQTRPGLRRNARGVARSSGLYFAHRPVWASRKVGTPLSAETPAPVNTATRLPEAKRLSRSGGIMARYDKPARRKKEDGFPKTCRKRFTRNDLFAVAKRGQNEQRLLPRFNCCHQFNENDRLSLRHLCQKNISLFPQLPCTAC